MTAKPVRQLIDNEKRAWSFARAVVSDVFLYNRQKVEEGIENDNLFTLMDSEIEEGRDLFQKRVTEEIYKLNIYERVVVDKLIKPNAHLKSKMW